MWWEPVIAIAINMFLVWFLSLATIVVVGGLTLGKSIHSFWPSLIISWFFWVLIIAVFDLVMFVTIGVWIIGYEPWPWTALTLFYAISYRELYVSNITRL